MGQTRSKNIVVGQEYLEVWPQCWCEHGTQVIASVPFDEPVGVLQINSGRCGALEPCGRSSANRNLGSSLLLGQMQFGFCCFSCGNNKSLIAFNPSPSRPLVIWLSIKSQVLSTTLATTYVCNTSTPQNKECKDAWKNYSYRVHPVLRWCCRHSRGRTACRTGWWKAWRLWPRWSSSYCWSACTSGRKTCTLSKQRRAII